MTQRGVSVLSKNCVNSTKISTIMVQKSNCKMSSKLMLRRENMKRTKKFRQHSPSLKACQNSVETTLITSVILIIITLSGRRLRHFILFRFICGIYTTY